MSAETLATYSNKEVIAVSQALPQRGGLHPGKVIWKLTKTYKSKGLVMVKQG